MVPRKVLPKTAEYKSGDFLFPICYQDRWGFINQKGEVLVATVFYKVGEFVEGLAPARRRGTYGYINQDGKFSIKDTFDYAEEFSDGLARVWIDGKCIFINKDGKKAFDVYFTEATPFVDGMSKIRLEGNNISKEGMIDRKGNYILEPIYRSVSDFEEGFATVTKFNKKDSTGWDGCEVAVINKKGEFVIPFGTYNEIGRFKNGFAEVSLPPIDEDWGDEHALIDTTGQVKIKFPHRIHTVNSVVSDGYHQFSEGLIGVGLPVADNWEKMPNGEFVNAEEYSAFMNVNGQFVVKNKEAEYAYPFHEQRTFAGKYYQWWLMDANGKVVGTNVFNDVLKEGFENGRAIVQDNTNERWGVIGLDGNYVIQPRYLDANENGFQEEGLLVAVADPRKKKIEDEEEPKIWGLINNDGEVIINPRFTYVDDNGFRDGLLFVMEDSLYGYVTKEGKYVWKQVQEEIESNGNSLDSLNIDYRMRGYFMAYGLPTDKEVESGGWAKSANIPKKISPSNHFKPSLVAAECRPEEKDSFNVSTIGARVYVYNTSKDTIEFEAQDSRLYMKVQALNRKGDWVNIEYIPHSWCGNSYHTIQLPPGYFWKFVTPVYQGSFNTKLRIHLVVHGKTKDAPLKEVFSEPYEGSINPAQFWRERDYRPYGIMDPYLH